MSKQNNHLAEFGPYVFDLTERILQRGTEEIRLPPQGLKILEYLVKNRERVVSKDELQEQCWGEVHVSEGTINKQVSDVRVALAAGGEGTEYIETRYKRGWRFVAQVTERTVAAETTGVPAEPTGELVRNPSDPPRRLPHRARRHLPLTVLVVAAVAGSAALAALLLGTKTEPRVLKFRPLTNDGREKWGPLVSDGQRLYFTEADGNSTRVVSVPLSGGEAQPVSNVKRGSRVFDISADRRNLLVVLDDSTGGELWAVPTSGSAPKHLTALAGDASWAPDSERVAVSRTNSLMIQNVRHANQVTGIPLSGEILSPRWSRDGGRIRFSRMDRKTETVALWEVPAKGGRVRQLTALSMGQEWARNGEWSQDGRYFFYQAGKPLREDLWVAPEHRKFFEFGEEKPLRLTDGPGSWSWPVPLPGGSEIAALNTAERTELVKWNASKAEWEQEWNGSPAYELDFSRDGKWVVYTNELDHTIWKARADGSARVALTDKSLEAHQPHWSPDNRRIAFMGKRNGGPWRIFITPAMGGPIEELLKDGDDQGVPTWSSDGRFIVYGEFLGRKATPEMSVHLLDIATRERKELDHSKGLWSPRWSPNGKYIAAVTTDGRSIRVLHWPGLDWREIERMAFIDNVTWSADSRFLYFDGYREQWHFELFRVDALNGKLERLADLQGFSQGHENWFGVAPDGTPLALRGVSVYEIWALKCALP